MSCSIIQICFVIAAMGLGDGSSHARREAGHASVPAVFKLSSYQPRLCTSTRTH
jgi:hypothetical protein